MSSVLTVSQINTYLKSLIDGDSNLKNIYVSGEISNFTNHYRTGHFYFTVKDDKAAIKAVMFRSAAERLRFVPENGMKVLVRCNVSLYERDGVYQLYCEDMQPDGVGELTVAFEQLKERLSKEGLFASEHKKPLPHYPQRIGVVTSTSGAAIEDIKNVLSRRYPFAEIILAGVLVQGDDAPIQIADAIRRFDRLGCCDVLIVGRGGGSVEDLWAFNDEGVARAIYDCSVPVVSAVGHEVDFTISDFVADMRAPTPSAAAEIVAPDYKEVLYAADKTLDSMTDKVLHIIDRYTLAINELEKRIYEKSPVREFELYSMCVNALEEKLNVLMHRRVELYKNALTNFAVRIDAVSPLKVLGRGYAMVKNDVLEPVKTAHKINEGENITVIMRDGTLSCVCEKIVYEENCPVN
ncbi:MAG: exodeoxyribonuclease VII large subunit [Ruminococcaceae bacterium]|nr:exodeoxyribonuclease VII large subunit [Oscillospiraceae bacterium]